MYNQTDKYIQNAKPRTDCIYCQVHNFVDMKGNKLQEQYAQCTNKIVSMGMVSIDIVLHPEPFGYNTSCQKCKHYNSQKQLTLF